MQITINLLPSEHKNRKAQRKTSQMIFTLCFILIGIVVALTILVFSYNAIQNDQIADINNQLDQQKSNLNQYAKIQTSISQISNTLVYIDDLGKKGMKWDKFLNEFTTIIPEKAQISSLKISTLPSATIDVTGRAESRREVIKLFEKMKITPYFSDPELKSLQKAGENSGFQFSIGANLHMEKI